jgi:hypothetical protein
MRSFFTGCRFTKVGKMDNKITFQLDNVTIQREADGIITITPKAGGSCVSIGLLIGCILATLMGIAWVVSGIFQLFHPTMDSNPGTILFGLFATAMFGSYALYLFIKMLSGQQQEQIIISPILNLVKIGNREIPFSDIVEVATHHRSIKSHIGDLAIRAAEMNGIGNLRFQLILSNGDTVEIGEVAVNKSKLDERETEIITLLKKAIKRNQ